MSTWETTKAEFAEWLNKSLPSSDVDFVMTSLGSAAIPERSAASFRSWVFARQSVGVSLSELLENKPLVQRFLFLAGASQAVCDSFVQSPELAMILADPGELGEEFDVTSLTKEGESLVEAANSTTHALDRVRFLKQMAMLKLIWNDLTGRWPAETIWTKLSEITDATLSLVANTLWRELSDEACPVAIIALGKHGGREINYSSDVDVMFILQDEYQDETLAQRFCERFLRGVGGKMGRGTLYRVDCRLRPMGKIGPIIQRCTPTVSYYTTIAEPWEIMAMIRARPLAGNLELGKRFLDAIDPIVYRGPRSEQFLSDLLNSKRRYEHEVERRGEADSNIKLGYGGIRDIEFLVQVLQLVTGHEFTALKSASTLNAIAALQEQHLFTAAEAQTLTHSYRFLRQLEHRIQLLNDLQTHTIPEPTEQREAIARLMGFVRFTGLEGELKRTRYQVRAILESRVPALKTPGDPAEFALDLYSDLAPAELLCVKRLLELSPNAESFAHELRSNEKFQDQVRLIATRAPHIIPTIAFHDEMWDIAFSEEIELVEADEFSRREWIANELQADPANWEAVLAKLLRHGRVSAALKHAYHRDIVRSFRLLTELAEAAILETLNRCGGEAIDVVAAGRLGGRDLLLVSDWDLFLLCPDSSSTSLAERVGEELVKASRRISIASQWFPLDARLRPEGQSGRLTHSHRSFNLYAETRLETWERVALSRARSLREREASESLVRQAVFGPDWTTEDEDRVSTMRQRIHTERVRPGQLHREIKLGPGGMLDIEWIASVLKLRMGLESPKTPGTLDSLTQLAESGKIEVELAEALASHFKLFSNLRNALYLLEMDSDSMLPENPDKLRQIAHGCSLNHENELLRIVQDARNQVMAIAKSQLGWEMNC